MNYFRLFIAIWFIGMVIGVTETYHEMRSLQKKNAKLQAMVDKSETEAFDDCRRLMDRDRSTQRVNGCVETIDILCRGSENPIQCFNIMGKVCQEVGK
jgi:hypothetical protein